MFNLNIVGNRKIWYTFSGLVIAAAIGAIAFFGFKLGIDFTGGALIELEFVVDRPMSQDIQKTLEENGYDGSLVQHLGESGVLIRTKPLTPEAHKELLNTLDLAYSNDDIDLSTQEEEVTPGLQIETEGAGLEIEVVSEDGSEFVSADTQDNQTFREVRFDTIGPTISNELRRKSINMIIGVVFAIILYVSWAFRSVSKPVSSWKYGVIAVVALLHDVLVPAGVFSYLGKFIGAEIDTLFVTAMLTVMGFSVHDTIVVFDRVRETIERDRNMTFSEAVNRSVNQTLTRSINTSVTTLVVLAAIYFFGGESVRYFSLAMMIGIFTGTYSSIFIASPLLVSWYNRQYKRE